MVALVLVMVWQYAVLLWFPPGWDIAQPWDDWSYACTGQDSHSSLTEYFYISDYTYCVLEWTGWLLLGNFDYVDMSSEFLALLCMALFTVYFDSVLPWTQRKELPEPGDTQDFTYMSHRTRNWYMHLKYLIFSYFHIFLLFIVFMTAVEGHNLDSGGFICIAYLFISYYYLYRSKLLYKKRHLMISIMKWYNYIIIGIHIAFQCPVFPCSIIFDDRDYIGAEECKVY